MYYRCGFLDGDNVITTFTIEAVQQSTANNPPQVQSTTDNRTGTSLPQTGVTSNTTLWAVLLTVSMFSAALVWYKLRKMKNPL